MNWSYTIGYIVGVCATLIIAYNNDLWNIITGGIVSTIIYFIGKHIAKTVKENYG